MVAPGPGRCRPPSFLGELHFTSLEYALVSRWTPERRRLDYLRYVGASDETAKEVHIFDLAPWLVERYRRLAERLYKENKRLSIRKGSVSTALSIVGTLGYYAAYLIILVRAVHGIITLGSLIFLAGAFARSRDLLQHLLLGASGICQQCLYLKDLFDFFETKPSISSPPGAPAVPRPIRQGFVFQDVGFRYPGRDAWAVRHVNFHLHPGEHLAFVGENGAGKTTLIKLLARLYDPTEGRILLDGVDLRDYDLQSVRRAIGVIFQDFVRYDLRFDENIGVGAIDAVRSYLDQSDNREPVDGAKTLGREHPGGEAVPVAIVAAAEKSLAASLLPGFSEGYQQMLGRRFDRGVELSGGEWQKIALARAYIRDAQCSFWTSPRRRSMRAPSTKSSSAFRTSWRGRWRSLFRIASPRCGWPTASSSFNMAPWSKMGRTRRWWHRAVCMPHSLRYRRRGTGKPGFDTPSGCPTPSWSCGTLL